MQETILPTEEEITQDLKEKKKTKKKRESKQEEKESTLTYSCDRSNYKAKRPKKLWNWTDLVTESFLGMELANEENCIITHQKKKKKKNCIAN